MAIADQPPTGLLHGKLRPVYSKLFAAGSILLLWEAIGRMMELRPEVLPTPARILMEMSDQAEKLQSHSLISTAEILAGYLLAAALAFPAAFVLSMVPLAARAGYPVLRSLRQAPLVLLIPVFFLWFGFGLKPEILIVFSLCFIPMAAGAFEGLQSVPEPLKDTLRMMGASGNQILVKAGIPSGLPNAIAALKTAVPLAVVGATAGEFAQAEMGLGSLMLASAFKHDTPMVFAALTVAGLIGLGLYGLIVLLEHLSLAAAGRKLPALP
jgi:NitT/TauT family transport system permease protein